MLLNPMDRYCEAKGMREGIRKGKIEDATIMLEKGFKMEDVVEITGLSEEEILNGK